MWRTVSRGGPRARLAVLGLAGVLALTTSGCSLLSGGSGEDPGSASKPKIQVGADKHVKGAIASETAPYQGYKIQVDVVSLTRYDKVMRLVLVITPISAGSTDALPKDTFGETDYTGNLSSVVLLDTKGLQEYDPLTRGTGDNAICACSYPDDFSLDQPTTVYADYPAPPDSVTQMTVRVPKLAPIPNVKVSS